MAIALYGATASNITANPTTVSVDGGTGANRIIMWVACGPTSDSISAVTWNGESLTKGMTRLGANTRYNYIWYLYNPTGTGTQNLVITGDTDSSKCTTLVYTGVGGIPTDFVSNGATAVEALANSHTAVDGDWLVGVMSNTVNTSIAGTDTTLRSVSSSAIQVDSNGVASPTALNITWTNSGDGDAVGCVISPPAAANTGFFQFM